MTEEIFYFTMNQYVTDVNRVSNNEIKLRCLGEIDHKLQMEISYGYKFSDVILIHKDKATIIDLDNNRYVFEYKDHLSKFVLHDQKSIFVLKLITHKL